MSVKARFVRLPKGGRAIRAKVTVLLTRYDLVSTAIYAKKQGETEVTRSSCCRYLRRILEEHGVEGFISIYNRATAHERSVGENVIGNLFPELTTAPKVAV